MSSTRLGKRERQLRREQWAKFREVRNQVVADNVANLPKQTPRVAGVPYGTLAGRSCQIEKANLFLHSHTKGAYAPGIGQGSGPKAKKKHRPGRFEPAYWFEDYNLSTKDGKKAEAEVWRGTPPKGERLV